MSSSQPTVKPIDILGSYWTLAVGADAIHEQRCFHDFRKRVETAAKAGYTGLGLWHADMPEIQKKYSFAEMKQILDANGIVNIEVEWLLDWFTTGERRKASDATRALLLEAAETLEARHIKNSRTADDLY